MNDKVLDAVEGSAMIGVMVATGASAVLTLWSIAHGSRKAAVISGAATTFLGLATKTILED